MANHITMTLKREWFDAIFFGDKREEYREIKPYWIKRLVENHQEYYHPTMPLLGSLYLQSPLWADNIRFRNGYQKDAREFTIKWKSLRIDTANPKWVPSGTPSYQRFLVLELGDIVSSNFA